MSPSQLNTSTSVGSPQTSRIDLTDVVLSFNSKAWSAANERMPSFDFND